MEKKTTLKFCKSRLAVATVLFCFVQAAFAQNHQMTLGESWSGTDWENAYQSVNTYDSNDYLTGTVSQVWLIPTGPWENAIRYTYTNNSTGGATLIATDVWDDVGSNWTTSQQTINTLNATNQVLTSISQIWIGGSWMNISKGINTYGSGYLTSTINQNWDFVGSSWVNSAMVTYTNNPGGNPTQSLSQTWNSGTSSWDNESKSTYAYNGSGQMITEFTEDWTGNGWQNSELITNEYSGGYLSLSLSQIWSVVSDSWQNDSQSLFTTNSNGTIAQIVMQNWDIPPVTRLGASNWVNATRLTFTYENLAVPTFTQNATIVYPNPARDLITVQTTAENLSSYRVADQRERIVMTGRLDNASTEIDISSLSAGSYLLQFGANRNTTIKLIKQ